MFIILLLILLIRREKLRYFEQRKAVVKLLFLLLLNDLLVFGMSLYLKIMYNYKDFMKGILEILVCLGLVLAISFTVFCLGNAESSGFIYRIGRIWQKAVIEKTEKKPEDPYFRRFRMIAVPLFGPVYMVCFFSVTELYFSNKSEWLFSYRNISMSAIAGSVAVWILLCVLAAFLCRDCNTAKRAAVGMASVFAAMYLQNMLLNGSGFINGSVRTHSWVQLFLNNAFWFVMIALPQLLMDRKGFRDKVFSGAVFLSAALCIMQVVPLPMFFISGEAEEETHTLLGLSGEEQFTVSTEGTVVVFIMDTYCSEFFEDYMAGDLPKYEWLSDFTFFDNVTTRAEHTAFSLPYMLTASDIDLTARLKESNRAAWEGENAEYFYSTAKDMGYDAYLYTESALYSGGAENMNGKISNLQEAAYERENDPLPTWMELVKFSLYRYVPFSLKDIFLVLDSSEINRHTRLFYYNPESGRSDQWKEGAGEAKISGVGFYNGEYYSGLKGNLTPESGGKRIIFEHLFGMHPPLKSLDDENYVSEAEETQICMEIVNEYISQLKEMGLYDSTAIIITADHGADTISRLDPVMLIKGFDENGEELTVSRVPGCLQTDLLPTILDMIGADPEGIKGGTSLFRLDEQTQRERILRLYSLDPEFPPVPKCDSEGDACFNCYREYRYTGRSEDIDRTGDLVVTAPIVDYFW